MASRKIFAEVLLQVKNLVRVVGQIIRFKDTLRFHKIVFDLIAGFVGKRCVKPVRGATHIPVVHPSQLEKMQAVPVEWMNGVGRGTRI